MQGLDKGEVNKALGLVWIIDKGSQFADFLVQNNVKNKML